jgi:hypothetical protein
MQVERRERCIARDAFPLVMRLGPPQLGLLVNGFLDDAGMYS